MFSNRTLFSNALPSLPSATFEGLNSGARIGVSCKGLVGIATPVNTTASIVCASSGSFYVTLKDDSSFLNEKYYLKINGFSSKPCSHSSYCTNSTLCQPGHHGGDLLMGQSCIPCPPGGFYQDEQGQMECKHCSRGTYVPVERHPGSSPLDCWACPAGTETDKIAGYRACKCLTNFYRMDRFGACSTCPKKGILCENDAAILAPNYYWSWISKTQEDQYQMFVENIAVQGPSYDPAYTKFNGSLPVAHWCFRENACLGGIKAECNEGYTGLLCSQCNNDYYHRMNTCEKCPTKFKAVLLVVGVIIAFILVMVAVIWGDSKRAGQSDRTWADVILSRFKIIISFYQVMMGVFSTLTRVKWPASIIAMTRWLRFVEANILELGPLSCIDPRLRFDPLQRFALAVCLNAGVVFVFLTYLKIRGILIRRKSHLSIDEKREALSAARKSCYRNIFLFLFTTYPSTCVKIVQIVPSACIPLCFSEHEKQCSTFLRSDLSVKCFTSRYNTYWPFAMVLLLYPVGFPILILGLLWKFYHKRSPRQAHTDDQQSPSESTQPRPGQCDHATDGPTVSTDQHDHSNSTRTLQDCASQWGHDSCVDTVPTGSSNSCPPAVVSTSTNGPISDDAGPNDEISDEGGDQQMEGDGCPHEQESNKVPDITAALSLFYENYKRDYWFWEVTEMYRKLILVTGLSLIGSHSRTQIGIGVLLAGFFSILHAAYQPITDKFENALQSIALLVLFFDLTLGVMLKIADTDIPADVNIENDTTGVEVLFMLVNCLVIAIALVMALKIILPRIIRCCRNSSKGLFCCVSAVWKLMRQEYASRRVKRAGYEQINAVQ